jgi:hypothetical protein
MSRWGRRSPARWRTGPSRSAASRDPLAAPAAAPVATWSTTITAAVLSDLRPTSHEKGRAKEERERSRCPSGAFPACEPAHERGSRCLPAHFSLGDLGTASGAAPDEWSHVASAVRRRPHLARNLIYVGNRPAPDRGAACSSSRIVAARRARSAHAHAHRFSPMRYSKSPGASQQRGEAARRAGGAGGGMSRRRRRW